jgi:hypothetical protein
MGFRVIEGTFHVKGYSPDGDSIRFKANNDQNWQLLDGPPAKRNARGHVQLRLEAIDTLETHFLRFHQPLQFARAALNHLLLQVGISNVLFNLTGGVVTEADDGSAGYIVSREVEKNRRPVSFVFRGNPPAADGSEIFFEADLLVRSANAAMLSSGLAYPTYYKGLFPDLREALTELVTAARAAGAGVWPHDKTNAGFDVTGLESITEEHVILPKLFRRLASYLEAGGAIQGFDEHLAELEEEMLVISTAHSTHFDTVVKVQGNTVKMTELPENLMFLGG